MRIGWMFWRSSQAHHLIHRIALDLDLDRAEQLVNTRSFHMTVISNERMNEMVIFQVRAESQLDLRR